MAQVAAKEGAAQGLALVRQMIGNNDEITDLRFVGPSAAPTHLAVATNSEQVLQYPARRVPLSGSLLPGNLLDCHLTA